MNHTSSSSIHTLQLGPMENFVYLIQDHRSKQAAVVDPAWEIHKVLDLAKQKGLQITQILLTHSHHDHVNGLPGLLRKCDAQIHLSEAEAQFWQQPLTNSVLHQDGDVFHLGDTEIEVWHTPGHTPGSACFHLNGHILTGDTLFVVGCGRCDLEGGNSQQMTRSLQRLASELPLETVVHPGHHYAERATSTIAEQLVENPFMQFEDRANFTHQRAFGYDRERLLP